MKSILYSLLLIISTALPLAAQSPECNLRGCIHDGGDAVIIFNLDNKSKKSITCCLAPSEINAMAVQAESGRVFTDIDCYIGSRCVSSPEKARSFTISGGEDCLVSMVVHDVPEEVSLFKDIEITLDVGDSDVLTYNFENVTLLGEQQAKKIKTR